MNADFPPAAAPQEQFDVARRGYDRRQVEDFADRARRHVAALQDRLARALRDAEQLQAELAAARRAAWEASTKADLAAKEITALQTHAQIALTWNMQWSPPQQGAARLVGRGRRYRRPVLPVFGDCRGATAWPPRATRDRGNDPQDERAVDPSARA